MVNLKKYKEYNILYVEDEHMIRNNVEGCLKYIFNVICAKDGEEGLKSFLSEKIDLVITDLNMPKKNGLTMLKNIRVVSSKTPFIITSAFTPDLLEELKQIEKCTYLAKPFDIKVLIAKSISALEIN